jgi:Bifunctional DNA primase/polymerase, N-terminal
VSARTARGMHFFFRLDKPMKSWSRHEGDLQFDVRADGAGVILPPSVHHTGADYGWDRTPKS